MTPDSSDLAYPTPRSWEFVSNLLKLSGGDPTSAHSMIAACIGNDTALEFESFCKGFLTMPSVSDIMAGVCREYPKSHDVTYALISSIISTLSATKENISQDELNNICDYIIKLPKDYVMAFVKDVMLIDGMDMKIMKCYSLQDWVIKNKKYL